MSVWNPVSRPTVPQRGAAWCLKYSEACSQSLFVGSGAKLSLRLSSPIVHGACDQDRT